jgi:alpha-1,2-mannosyltransferase
VGDHPVTTTSNVSAVGAGSLGLTRLGLRQAAGRASATIVYAVLPALLLTVILSRSFGDHFAFDFHQFWQGGRDVLAGRSPYPAAASLPTGSAVNLDPVGIQDTFRFPYPAPAALAMVPFGLLPFNVAASIFLLCSVAAIFVALWILGVVDWRCYGVLFASMTTLGALRLGTFTPLLLLGLALAWRYRDTRILGPLVVACVVVAKLFLWPLFVWLLLTRRFRTAGLAFVLAAAVTLGSWALLGFAGLRGYPHLLSVLAATVQGKGWSVVALGLALGLSAGIAKVSAVALGSSVLAVTRVAPSGETDRWAFSLAIAAAILLSPIVWLHYLLLLAVPLALAYPTLAPAWFIPLALWVWPFQETGGTSWKICLGLGVLAAATASALLSPPRPRPS